MTIPVFDGHNDFLLRLWRNPGERPRLWAGAEARGHIDLPRMRAGGFIGGLFAIYVPSPDAGEALDIDALMDAPPYSLPLPTQIATAEAQPVALAQAAHLLALARENPDDFTLCRTVEDIRAAMAGRRIAAVMHMEGAEAIDPDLDALYAFHALGLRSIGPVWSRPTAFGHGVPFAFPSSPDTGPGLTEAGKRLVAACNELRVLIDLSHLNERGFDDVARLSTAPLVATHSNAHALTPSSRNLTDRQLDVIRASGGLVGLNFATVFLRSDGRRSPDMGWGPMLAHLDYLLGRLGEEGVALGSDFDGATLPAPVGDVAGLPALTAAMTAHGYDRALIDKICHANWLSLLQRIWGS